MSEAEHNTVEVGCAVWVFDINIRKYRKDENGRSFGGPIWREHWQRQEIVSETSRSWITNYGEKIPKARAGGRGIAFSEEEIEREAFVQENRHKIAFEVQQIKDHELLKKVAELIGYREVR